MLTARLYLLQRLTAFLMAPLVIGHLIMMIYAVQNGLSAEEVLGRTSGSVSWAFFYGTFVVAASIHAAIGVRVIFHETFGLKGLALDILMVVLGAILLVMGSYAVYAVIAA